MSHIKKENVLCLKMLICNINELNLRILYKSPFASVQMFYEQDTNCIEAYVNIVINLKC